MWHLVERFPTVEAFRSSQIYPQLKMFTLKNSWKSGQTKVESWVCKYARKAQYKKCQRMLKLEYQLSRMEVFDNDNHCDHTWADRYIWQLSHTAPNKYKEKLHIQETGYIPICRWRIQKNAGPRTRHQVVVRMINKDTKYVQQIFRSCNLYNNHQDQICIFWSFLGPNDPFRLFPHHILCPTGLMKE